MNSIKPHRMSCHKKHTANKPEPVKEPAKEPTKEPVKEPVEPKLEPGELPDTDMKETVSEPPKKKRKRKRDGTPRPSRPPTKWMTHVKTFAKSHPDLKFKEVLQQAKLTYVKESK